MGNARQARGTIVELALDVVTVAVDFGVVRRRVRARRGGEVADVRLAVGDEVVVSVSNLDLRSGVILRVV